MSTARSIYDVHFHVHSVVLASHYPDFVGEMDVIADAKVNNNSTNILQGKQQ